MKESDLFPYLKDYFQTNPYSEIFTEVAELEGGRPDIVVRTEGKLITIVEMKTTLSMDLMEQAINWRHKANYIYIAIPKPKQGRIHRFALKILKEYGIGILLVKTPDEWELNYLNSGDINLREFVNEELKPKFYRTKKDKVYWNEKLKDIYRCENNVHGGNSKGGYNTPYKEVINAVKWYIKYKKRNEATSITELIEKIPLVKGHYYSPKGSLYNALTKIEHNEFESVLIKNKIHFKLKEEVFNDLKHYDS